MMNIAIVGAGLIGWKRAEAIAKTRKGKLVAVADVDLPKASALAQKYGAEAVGDWKKIMVRKDIHTVLIAVPNAFAAPIVTAALKSGKHVFCEKPFGVNPAQSRLMMEAARKAGRVLKVGFNHRFHAAVQKAHGIFEAGGIGKILLIRARYGHGGRKGMEKEWRFNKKISGGGELLDQGVHIVDLARWFAGEFDTAYGVAQTKFWRTKLDDNAFAILKNKRATVSFHVSTTNWKNIFSFEVFGDRGFLEVRGKGGSYGTETLVYGKRRPEFGVPLIKTFTFEGGDKSWEREWTNFHAAVVGGVKPIGDAMDGLRANELLYAIYRSSSKHGEVRLPRRRY